MKMNYYKICDSKMVGVINFSKDKHEKFCRRNKYYSQLRHGKLDSKKLDFREELIKALHKRK
ncbi:MAG: hypothetical protein IJA10_10965 [Lachnospiraceae bacterium]|nr:hypothetical protein [Lachnospiraceae bacterium]